MQLPPHTTGCLQEINGFREPAPLKTLKVAITFAKIHDNLQDILANKPRFQTSTYCNISHALKQNNNKKRSQGTKFCQHLFVEAG